MPLFNSYAKPGVYVSETTSEAGIPLFGSARIPVLIGEGEEQKSFSGINLHRGSSSVADETVVQENIADQVTGLARTFQLTYFPVVKGDGRGTLSNDPKDIKVFANDIPVMVSSLNGTTGVFTTQSLIPTGTDLRVDYSFKREDTFISNEDLSLQVPVFASLSLYTGDVVVSPAIPGALGNAITITLTDMGAGVGPTDALAVTGIGTDAISIELRKPSGTVRTKQDVANLLNAGVTTLSGGVLTAVVVTNGGASATAAVAASFSGGAGPSTNKIFKVAKTPMVDGSNGGVVTTSVNSVTVLLNGTAVQVAAVDGLTGLVTLANPVAAGATLTVSYYTNNYQDTFDVLPGLNITEITNVGYGPGRSDFIDGVDFVLETGLQGAKLQWGASANVKAGNYTTGYNPFNGASITTTLVDEKVYFRPCTGVTNGRNAVFTLEDVPVDGSGLARATDDPSKIYVYVGSNPGTALSNGPVRVIQLSGASKTISLYNPPSNGSKVYASYYRTTLNDHTYTMNVVAPGVTGQGTYKIQNDLGVYLPVIAAGTHIVTDANFQNTGIVWPSAFSDLTGIAGATPNETVTLTFQDDSLTMITSAAVQATNITAQVGLRFRATNTGTGPNATTGIVLTNVGGPTADATAVVVSTETITIQIVNGSSATRTLQDIINLFANGNAGAGYTTALAGRIICEAVDGASLTTACSVNANTKLSGGAAAVSTSYANRFKVTSSRTAAQCAADGLARTGNATTLTAEVGADGYTGQTYIDAKTGVKFTLVEPRMALSYGYTQLPSPSYGFKPGDKLTFVVNSAAARYTSAVPTIDVPGLRVKVTSTYGIDTNSTAILSTFNKSGSEPSVGEFYYVDFKTAKTAKDFELKLFTNVNDAFAEYGQPSPINKLSLGARLFAQNGGQIFACIQVPKQVGLDLASDQSFKDAIASLAQPLPGSENKASVIVPMTTTASVLQYLNRHLITQGSQRMGGEAIAYIGFDNYATPADARKFVKALTSDRVVALYPGTAILTMDVAGKSLEYAVDGSFIAAAVAGLDLNPANDVATSLTRKNIVGLDRLVKRFDDVTMDLAAADGVCWLTERGGALQIRHYLTTNPATPLTREPSNRKVADEVHARLRRNLDQFIARKILTSLLNDITVTVHATLKTMVEQELVEAYKDLVVSRDENDPTVVHVSLKFKPVFSLMWLDVNLTVTTKI